MELKNFLIGSLLGDGSFVQKTPRHNVYVVFKHCESQYDYLNWKYQFLNTHGLIGSKTKGIVKVRITPGSCYPNFQPQYKFSTKSDPMLNKIKSMTEDDIVLAINDEVLAIWILDDGSTGNKVIKISCGTHSKSFCKKVVEKLQEMGYNSYLYEHPTNPKKNSINFRVSSYEEIKRMVVSSFNTNLDVLTSKFGVESDETLPIKVKYFGEPYPTSYIGGAYASNWIDLRAAEDVELKQGDFRMIPLGVAMQLPQGYEAHIIPRSSTYKNFGIIQANHMGLIDESYCGDNDQWHFPAIAMRDTVIHAGDRICQFRIMEHQPRLYFVAVETLGNRDRGGIGSTGIR